MTITCTDCNKRRDIKFFRRRSPPKEHLLCKICVTCLSRRTNEWRLKNMDMARKHQADYRERKRLKKYARRKKAKA